MLTSAVHLPNAQDTNRHSTRHDATVISRPRQADSVKSADHLPISVTGSNACVDGRQPSDSRANNANNVGANTGLAVKVDLPFFVTSSAECTIEMKEPSACTDGTLTANS